MQTIIMFIRLLAIKRAYVFRKSTVGTLYGCGTVSLIASVLITSDLCTIFEAIERVECYKHCGLAKVRLGPVI